MSTSDPTPSVPEQTGPVDMAEKRPGEIKLVSRSMLFYWWPVWVVAFFCAAWTFIENNRLAILPADGRVTVMEGADGVVEAGDGKNHPKAFVYTLSDEKAKKLNYEAQPIRDAVELSRDPNNQAWPTRISRHPGIGMTFVFTLVLVIFTTNVPLRGLWSFVMLLLLALIIVIISLIPGAWDKIFEGFQALKVHINLAGYLFIGSAVFILWAIAFFLFDPRQFVVFAPGQVRVCEHIGDAVEAYSTIGVQLTKERSDPFRHLLLGFGSADLVIKLSSGDRREFKIANVLGLNFKMAAVEEMIRTVPN